MTLRLEIVTIERLAFSGDVDIVIAPGVQGEMGILPQHAPLITALNPGELRFRQGDQEQGFAIGGGYLEVLNNQVTVLADSAFIADAAATRLGNEVGSSREAGQSIERALQVADSMPLLRGVLIIRGETLGAAGEIELIPLSGES